MAYTPRTNAGGNFCGHDPANPRFVSVANPHVDEGWTPERRDDLGHKRKAAWFYEADAKYRLFYSFPKTIPLLGMISKADDKQRKRRSEAREDDAKLLSALTHHLELSSTNWAKGFARVGFPTADGFMYFDNKFWMSKTGLSESQLKRSFGRLQAVGYVTRERRWVERSRGQFKGLATMTLISLDLFREIGLLDGLKDAAKHAYESVKKAAENLNVSIGRMLKCAFDTRRPKAAPEKPKHNPTDFPESDTRHWTSQLKPHQAEAFRHKYLEIYLEQGSAADAATVNREAFIYARRV
jgi:hypothetical protein